MLATRELQRLGDTRYRLQERLAAGGQAEVYRATDLRLQREVAVKMLRPEYRQDPTARERLHREVAVLRDLAELPGICPVHDGDLSHSDNPYFVMEVVGRTLTQSIHDPDQRRSRDELLHAFVAVCGTIAAAHDRGVLHRDLKPDNVLLGDHGQAFVIDWGLARRLDDAVEPERERAVRSAFETEPDAILGTPAYMSPEQARGENARVDLRSDVHALGVMLEEILTRTRPHECRSPSEVLRRTAAAGDRLPAGGRVRPARLARVVARATAARPEDRPSVRELAADVTRWLDRRGTRWRVQSTGLILLLILVGGTPDGGPRRVAPLERPAESPLRRLEGAWAEASSRSYGEDPGGVIQAALRINPRSARWRWREFRLAQRATPWSRPGVDYGSVGADGVGRTCGLVARALADRLTLSYAAAMEMGGYVHNWTYRSGVLPGRRQATLRRAISAGLGFRDGPRFAVDAYAVAAALHRLGLAQAAQRWQREAALIWLAGDHLRAAEETSPAVSAELLARPLSRAAACLAEATGTRALEDLSPDLAEALLRLERQRRRWRCAPSRRAPCLEALVQLTPPRLRELPLLERSPRVRNALVRLRADAGDRTRAVALLRTAAPCLAIATNERAFFELAWLAADLARQARPTDRSTLGRIAVRALEVALRNAHAAATAEELEQLRAVIDALTSPGR